MAWKKLLTGYREFRARYAKGDKSVMRSLSDFGQRPNIMVVACSDSRVDPALILGADPGDLFVVRNVANIIPAYEKDAGHHGVSAALEYGISVLKVKDLVIFGHSKCGGITALVERDSLGANDFIASWISLVKDDNLISQVIAQVPALETIDAYAKLALHQSYNNSMTFPWIKESVMSQKLTIHLWFFDIEKGEIVTYSDKYKKFISLGKED